MEKTASSKQSHFVFSIDSILSKQNSNPAEKASHQLKQCASSQATLKPSSSYNEPLASNPGHWTRQSVSRTLGSLIEDSKAETGTGPGMFSSRDPSSMKRIGTGIRFWPSEYEIKPARIPTDSYHVINCRHRDALRHSYVISNVKRHQGQCTKRSYEEPSDVLELESNQRIGESVTSLGEFQDDPDDDRLEDVGEGKESASKTQKEHSMDLEEEDFKGFFQGRFADRGQNSKVTSKVKNDVYIYIHIHFYHTQNVYKLHTNSGLARIPGFWPKCLDEPSVVV